MSNRLTFSLASLIFLIAFVAMPVMAHDADTTASPPIPEGHAHLDAPTVESVELVDHMTAAGSTVSGSNVMLVVDPTATPIVAADGTAAGVFTVKITFSDHLYTDIGGGTRTGPTAIDLTVTAAARSASSNNLYAASAADTAVSVAVAGVVNDPDTTDVDESDQSKVFFATFTVGLELFGGQTGDASDLPIDVWVTVDAGSGFIPTGLVDGTTTYGTANAASMREMFTVVSEFETPKPTVMIEAESGATVDAAFDVTFTFSDPAPSAFIAGDIMVTGGQVTDGPTVDEDNAKMWTATITPILGATEVTVGVASAKATGTAASVDATSDTTDPTVAITALVQSGRTLPIRITMADNTALASDAAIDAASEVTVTGGTLGTLTKAGDVYSGDITINYDTTSVMVTVAADAVADTSGNMSDAASETFTVTAVSMERDEILAGGYRVLVGPNFNSDTLPGVDTVTINNFPPDLAEYLVAGATINVEATGGDVIINEIMVARDTNKLGDLAGEPTDGQWIELWNKHGTAAATGIKVTFNQEKPANSPSGYADRFTNVAGQGWAFIGKFGEAVLNGSTHKDNPVNFVSIRRTDAGKDGSDQAAWGTAVASLLFAPGRVGTPGAKNTVAVFTPVGNTTPKRTDVLISEVANRMDNDTEWIELKGPANKSLKNWRLSIATTVGTETTIFQFPNNDNIRISGNGHLLLTDVDPLQNELEADYANGVPAPNRYKNAVVTLGALPNDGNFVLILRDHTDKSKVASIQDIAGHSTNLRRNNPFTTLWPLTGNVGVISSHNKLAGGKVYHRVRENINGYSATAGNKLHESAFAHIGFTGLGYDRNAKVTNENGGTPGYPRGNWKHNGDGAAGNVVISEIMFATGNGGPTRNRNLAQWIEIHNMSDVNSVNLGDWRLEIVNSGENADGTEYAHKFSEHVALSGTLPPNQTYLVVARRLGVSQETRLPLERIRNAGKKFTEQLLNPNGFHLTLRANVDRPTGEHKVIDTVGNLNPPPDSRRPGSHSFAGNAWELSALGDAINEDGTRISISRRHGAWSAPNMVATGTDMQGWILTSEDPRYSGIQQLTWFGRQDDHATPGYTIGAALPVSLSKFRPERLKDTGEIVIRWTTESELNNAGFNILRSETRDGEFTKLNTQLIAGQGTTSERTTYEWKDTTAKPNVVYFYQIQDVSIDGDIATLRTARLKGNVSAVGKATTTWGQLKTLQ